MWGIMVALVAGLGGYLYFYNRRVARRPWRSFSIAALIALAQAATVWVVVGSPQEAWLGLALPLTLITMIIVTAYDRRMALVVAGVTVAAVGVALSLSVAECLAIFAGAAAAAWRLGEIRSRGDVVRATVLVAAVLALGVLAVFMIERPATPGVMRELPKDMIQAAVGGFVAGALTLFLMPTVERIFDVTTGMTLSELRDPKQPLLRTLQHRAPGTYNHSLNVATIAEAAAQAIGADALHLYVGCLYHDVGKLNKPDYFVENQPRGLNKHDKLSPAMSLLVIMGHVKDGLALAREHNLPRSLHHYIESHHGETLVTYFYHQARQAAEDDASLEAPEEIEYRYPGPKPRTKEAAILMLCDGVEGATRAMSEPTPSRIAALVHEMSMARLHDGQFDECELTFAELSLIEDAIIKSLCSIYHGRIAYPAQSAEPRTTPGTKQTRTTSTA
jgi:putative nucleotidyltransferase with HDIG domain